MRASSAWTRCRSSSRPTTAWRWPERPGRRPGNGEAAEAVTDQPRGADGRGRSPSAEAQLEATADTTTAHGTGGGARAGGGGALRLRAPWPLLPRLAGRVSAHGVAEGEPGHEEQRADHRGQERADEREEQQQREARADASKRADAVEVDGTAALIAPRSVRRRSCAVAASAAVWPRIAARAPFGTRARASRLVRGG